MIVHWKLNTIHNQEGKKMEEDTKKEKTGEETDGLPTSSSPPEELSWWNGRKVKFADIMDL